MSLETRVWPVSVGYQWRVLYGCRKDQNGIHPSTADRIVGGWAATKDKAAEKITEEVAGS
jgi:hypothetical protein